jgi:hypothetical protein
MLPPLRWAGFDTLFVRTGRDGGPYQVGWGGKKGGRGNGPSRGVAAVRMGISMNAGRAALPGAQA